MNAELMMKSNIVTRDDAAPSNLPNPQSGGEEESVDARPAYEQPTRVTPRAASGRFRFAFSVLVAFVPTALFLAWSHVQFGSVLAVGGYLRGVSVYVARPRASLGARPVDRIVETAFTVWNFSRNPVRIVGSKSNCACVVVEDMPITVPAGGSRSIAVKIATGPKAGVIDQTVVFYTDAASRPMFSFRVTGQAVEAATSP